MLKDLRTVRDIAKQFADAADYAMSAYRQERAVEEHQITDRILGAIEDRLRNYSKNGIIWRAKTLRTGRGIAAEETRIGADLLGVLDVQLDGFSVQKGFLAQAKRVEPRKVLSDKEWERLDGQCEQMLSRTPDAFVFVYSRARGVRIIPAIAVRGYGGSDLSALYDWGLASFFEAFVECFIGDPRLNSADIKTLDALVDFPVRWAIAFEARRS